MTQAEMPFFDSAEAATKHAIEASGKTLKEVGLALWAAKSPDAARTALANALNENRDERLTADQHIFVANFCQQFHWLQYAAHRCNHSRPALVTPSERAAQLQARLFATAGEMEGLLAEIKRLRGQTGAPA